MWKSDSLQINHRKLDFVNSSAHLIIYFMAFMSKSNNYFYVLTLQHFKYILHAMWNT